VRCHILIWNSLIVFYWRLNKGGPSLLSKAPSSLWLTNENQRPKGRGTRALLAVNVDIHLQDSVISVRQRQRKPRDGANK